MVKKISLGQVDVARMAKELHVSREEIVFAFYVEKTFEEWRKAYNYALSDSEEEKTARAEMVKLAETFEEWVYMYEITSRDSEKRKVACAKMIELVETTDERRILYNLVSTDEEKKMVIRHLALFYEK